MIINFLTSPIESEEVYKKHNFSYEVLSLKNLQHLDISKLYNFSIDTDKIGFLIIHPKVESDYYCFDFIIFVKDDFNLNDLLKMKFNIIKIKSIKAFDENNLTKDLIFKLYDFYNFTFKDNIVLQENLKSMMSNFDNVILIPELIEWRKLMDLRRDHMRNFKVSYAPYDEDIKKLRDIIEIKQSNLHNKILYKKLFMEKMCTQFWIFHELILNDTIFFTNFWQLTGGITATVNDGKLEVDYNALYPCSWRDMLCDSDYQLFSIWQATYHWLIK